MSSYIMPVFAENFRNYPAKVVQVNDEEFNNFECNTEENFLITFRDFPSLSAHSVKKDKVLADAHDTLVEHLHSLDSEGVPRPVASVAEDGEIIVETRGMYETLTLVLESESESPLEVTIGCGRIYIQSCDDYCDRNFKSIDLNHWAAIRNFVESQIDKSGE